MKRIYLDYASLTPIDPRVIREVDKYSSSGFANPSSIYREGVLAKKALEDARAKVAGSINAHPNEIVFTGSGTEANGLVLEGCGRAARRSGILKPHIIISAIEHSSVMEAVKVMEKHGVAVTRLAVDHAGLISLNELQRSITPNTYMVSIMTVNNETGVVQPIREIAKIIRQARTHFQGPSGKGVTTRLPSSFYPLFHTDAAQAFLYEGLNVERLGVDLVTLDSSKVYGPRGVGALYIKRDTPIEPIIYGGGQERGLRSGTENLPGIAGFAKALGIAASERRQEAARIAILKEYFFEGLMKIRADIIVNPSLRTDGKGVPNVSDVHRGIRLTQSPHIINISIPGIANEFFVLQLDAKGISCSTKSSCLRGRDESYVLKAMGADSKTAVRFSFGRWTKMGDIKKALEVMSKILAK